MHTITRVVKRTVSQTHRAMATISADMQCLFPRAKIMLPFRTLSALLVPLFSHPVTLRG